MNVFMSTLNDQMRDDFLGRRRSFVKKNIEWRGIVWKFLAQPLKVSNSVCSHGSFKKNIARGDKFSAGTSSGIGD
jgi:hypothetical protein